MQWAANLKKERCDNVAAESWKDVVVTRRKLLTGTPRPDKIAKFITARPLLCQRRFGLHRVKLKLKAAVLLGK